MTLLNDIENVQSPNKKYKVSASNSENEDFSAWKFMDNSPHSPDTKPFRGGAQ